MMLYIILFTIAVAALSVLLWPVRQHRRFVYVAGAILFIAAGTLYYATGSPGIALRAMERQARLAEIRTEIVKQSDRVKADPDDLAAWMALAGAFIESGQYEPAVNALKRSVVLSHGDANLILAYARAMIVAEEGKVSDHAKKSLEMVLLQDKDNAEARYFLAVRKLQDGKTDDAMKDMKTLYRSLPKDSPVRKMIDAQIGRK